MQQNNNYRVKGAVFESDRPGNGPAFKGFVEIDGVKTEIVLWPKVSAKGQQYYQVSEDKKKHLQQAEQQGWDRGGPMNGAPVPRQQSFGNRSHTGPVRKYTPPTSGPQGGGYPQNDMDDDIPFNLEWR